ncbi:hypothetical protein H2199_004904 [Coniosporium tulheliwenetii]|uniref:Uncharacterized protein n=1 Tax=Coniosporium tulheliwenetii TaxID=3383036 RepID=A0ACC2Z5M2_9PEZI|nr:hypothetical protein H2199_004904 [Cladosporium sp. JES 115]
MMNHSSETEEDLAALPTTAGIPEESDPMSLSSDDAPNAPPPRIAARFYRYSNSRRKSSAASSRRNSISSSHSHLSNRSNRGNCQSNHVAQHLRRTSILENRKARLAAREAHAEQVRLRAALAKAAPRNSNSEERAQAAMLAREKHLAQVAASCAEEVRRAKKVAEEMKERKAAEEQRYRLGMEEKMAEAERRRAEYMRNGRRLRTDSVPASESKKPTVEDAGTLDEASAATRIQQAWRTRRRRRIVEDFLALGLSIDRVHDTSFEEIGSLLQEEKVVSTTGRIMAFFGLQKPDDTAVAKRTSVRTFLSAYLILGHPAQVLSKDGDQEQDLMNKAKELMITFESALSKLSASNCYLPTPEAMETISLVHTAYTTAFDDWKARDSSTLIETMVASFVNLDAIWQTVKDDTTGNVAHDYREGIRNNQAILLARIRKLAGQDRAATLIKKAIRESRRARPKRRSAAEVRPRAAETSVASNPVEVTETASAAAEVVARLGKARDVKTKDRESNALSELFSALPPNRILVHELAIDKEYRIETSPRSHLRNAANRAVCDGMRHGFAQGEGDKWTVAMADNIRSKLLHIMKPAHSLHHVISEALDRDHIVTQCQRGMFSYEKFFSFMATILPKLQSAGGRARATGNLEESIEKLFKLLHVIDLIHLDYSNYMLKQSAPLLIRESIGYEHKCFTDDLSSGKITLEKTKRWWTNAAIYARGLVDLAIAPPPLQDSEVPETLHLDKARISRIRFDARDVRSQWKAEATRMWETLKDGYLRDDGTMSARVLSIIESSHAMPAATKAQLSSTIARFLTQAADGRLADPVVKVLFQRLRTHVFGRVAASTSGERVRAASQASEGLASAGLPEFVTQVGEMVETLARVSEVDRKSHGLWYEQIAKEVEAMGDGDREVAAVQGAV